MKSWMKFDVVWSEFYDLGINIMNVDYLLTTDVQTNYFQTEFCEINEYVFNKYGELIGHLEEEA